MHSEMRATLLEIQNIQDELRSGIGIVNPRFVSTLIYRFFYIFLFVKFDAQPSRAIQNALLYTIISDQEHFEMSSPISCKSSHKTRMALLLLSVHVM